MDHKPNKCPCCDDGVLMSEVNRMLSHAAQTGQSSIWLPVQCLRRWTQITNCASAMVTLAKGSETTHVPIAMEVLELSHEFWDDFVALERAGHRVDGLSLYAELGKKHPWLSNKVWMIYSPDLDAARARAKANAMAQA